MYITCYTVITHVVVIQYMTVILMLIGPKCNYTLLRCRNAGEERRPHVEWRTFDEAAAKLQHITLPDDEYAKVKVESGTTI